MHGYYDTHRLDNPYKDYDYGNDGCPGEFIYGDDVYIDDYYMGELWKPIAGFEGLYWVSDMGRVWSEKKNWFLTIKPLDNHGHLGVCLYKNGKGYYRYIHRLVAEAFIPNPDNHPIVRHYDDVPSYNTVGDLRWGTHRDNAFDSIRNGTAYLWTKEDRQRSIEATRTPIIATNLSTGERILFKSQNEAGRVLGIPQANIWKVLNHERPRAQGYTFDYISREDELNGYY